MRSIPALAALLAALVSMALQQLAAAEVTVRQGEIRFEPAVDENARVPEPFRLGPHTFAFRQQMLPDVYDGFARSLVTFPSPVTTPHEVNNTVHCEYFRPTTAGKRPGCIVLHILGGDFELSRLFCNALAQRGIAALFVKMPYYGPRRPQGVYARMISRDPQATVAGMTQAVLDIRRAAAWLRSQEEVAPDQVGVFGISLGGITGALAASAEPRLVKVCLVLAGGDVTRIADIAWESPHLAEVRRKWTAAGGTKESLLALMQTVDPVSYASRVKDRQILMLNATHDEIIPKACTESLWTALGQPQIVWYPAGHISAALHMLDAIARVTEFFQPARP